MKVFEIKYSIHKNPKTLDNIINVLGEISNYANGDDIEYHQKMAHYCKLWIESPENADRGGWYENMVKIYLSSLIELRDNATFQTEFEKALNNSVAPETNRLAFILRWYAQDADEQGLKWAKETTEKMFNEGYIVSDSQQEYDDMRSVYEDIINL